METRNKIIELLKSTNREGVDNLIKHMEDNGFFTAPCSSQYHLCKEGGLAEHSLNVCKTLYEIADATEYNHGQNTDSLIITSILHDLGKMGQFGKPNYTENILASGKRSDKKPFETNKALLPIPHEVRSIQIAEKFIELTEEENYAIFFHNGLYVPSGRELNGKERQLQTLLHFADLYVSRFIEKEGE